jgi:hypothetical protein
MVPNWALESPPQSFLSGQSHLRYFSASKSNGTALKVAELNSELTTQVAESEAAHSLRLWQRTIMFPEGKGIIDQLSDLSDALIKMNLDSDENHLVTHVQNILSLRYKIHGRVTFFITLIATPTIAISEDLDEFNQAFGEIDRDESWKKEGSFGRSLGVAQKLMIAVAVTMRTELGLPAIA